MSWSQQNGLTAMVYKDSVSVLRDPIGKIVTPSSNHHALLTIGRTGDKGDAYAKALIRDVAVWKEEIIEKKMSSLHVCNGENEKYPMRYQSIYSLFDVLACWSHQKLPYEINDKRDYEISIQRAKDQSRNDT